MSMEIGNTRSIARRRMNVVVTAAAFSLLSAGAAFAQTSYSTTILPLAAGATGGSVDAIGAGQMAGSNSYPATSTSANGFTFNTVLGDAVLWTDATTAIALLPINHQISGSEPTPFSAVTGIAAGVCLLY